MNTCEKCISSLFLFCTLFRKLLNKYLKSFILVFSIIIIAVILAIHTNITVAADTPDYFNGESVDELIQWIKTEKGFYWRDFIDEVRRLGSILTVEVKTSEYILTDIQAQSFGYNAFTYTYTNRENNNDIILVSVRYPVKGYNKYSLEKEVADSNMIYEKSIATISGVETVYYYHDRYDYIYEEDGSKRHWPPAIKFEMSAHRIDIMGGYEPDGWNQYGYAVFNQYIEKHDIFLDMFEFHLTPLTDEPFFSLPYIEQENSQTEQTVQPEQIKKIDSGKWVIIGIAVMIVFCLSVIIFTYSRIKNS